MQALRLINLTVPPLDFHPVRQLRNLIVARSIYYQLLPNPDPQKLALSKAFYNAVGQYEPPITELLAAWTYTWTGGENIAVPRVYETVFWLLAGLALFDLATSHCLTGFSLGRPGVLSCASIFCAGQPFLPA